MPPDIAKRSKAKVKAKQNEADRLAEELNDSLAAVTKGGVGGRSEYNNIVFRSKIKSI